MILSYLFYSLKGSILRECCKSSARIYLYNNHFTNRQNIEFACSTANCQLSHYTKGYSLSLSQTKNEKKKHQRPMNSELKFCSEQKPHSCIHMHTKYIYTNATLFCSAKSFMYPRFCFVACNCFARWLSTTIQHGLACSRKHTSNFAD